MFVLYQWYFDAGPEDGLGAVPEVAAVARELGDKVGSRVQLDEDSIELLDCGVPFASCERHPGAFHCYTFRKPYLVLHMDQVLRAFGGRRRGRSEGTLAPAQLNKPWAQLSWLTKARLLGPSLLWPAAWRRIC